MFSIISFLTERGAKFWGDEKWATGEFKQLGASVLQESCGVYLYNKKQETYTLIAPEFCASSVW